MHQNDALYLRIIDFSGTKSDKIVIFLVFACVLPKIQTD